MRRRPAAEVAVDEPKRRSKKKKRTSKDNSNSWNAAQKCKTLQEIVDEAQYDLYPSWVPTFESVAAKPSVYPKRSFCKITGLIGKYKCPVTGDYLATLPAFETHRETRLKGLI